MIRDVLARRAFLAGAGRLAALHSAAPFLGFAGETSDPLDAFIVSYMKEMNAPGLTLALATRSGTVRTASFGVADRESQAPLTPHHLFQIGSITKSFVALTLLQLREEGKVDFEKPVLDYMPWLPIETNFGTVTVHHLLTHTSGLPNSLVLFPSNPSRRHAQAFKPGEHFDYCNLGFSILGHLITKLDQRPWTEAVKQRIMRPLGMTDSQMSIGDATRELEPKSYVPFYEDRVSLRHGPVAEAGPRSFEDAAGSIVSTPADMAKFMRMLLNRGEGLISAASFDLFSKPNLPAPDLSPTASYGYGIGVDKLDGHKILRHTGGTVSYMSAIHIDLDGGVAAFASINAQLGYRPNPVTQYAVQLMRASADQSQGPKPPEMRDAFHVKNAADFVGVYVSADGRKMDVSQSGDQLLVAAKDQSFALQAVGESIFLATDPEFQNFPFVFGRAGSDKADQTPEKAAPEPVVELCYGGDWYTNARYAGPKSISYPAEFDRYTGHYASESMWAGSTTIVVRKGGLWLDGATPLMPLGDNLFRLGIAEAVEFHYIVQGKARLVNISGFDFRRMQ